MVIAMVRLLDYDSRNQETSLFNDYLSQFIKKLIRLFSLGSIQRHGSGNSQKCF